MVKDSRNKAEKVKSDCKDCPKADKCHSAKTTEQANTSCSSESKQSDSENIKNALDHIRHKIFVMSGKGGVGKSSVSVNLAVALALKGFRVGLLDVDLHGPSIPRMLGLADRVKATEDALIVPLQHEVKNLQVLSVQSMLEDPDQAILWRGPMKTQAIKQFIGQVAWGKLDYLIIDSPPGSGDEHMTVLKSIPDALCLLVTTPQEVSLADVRKAINFLQYAQANILGLVENMSGLVCPHCQSPIELFKRGGGAEMAKEYAIRFLGAIPLDPLAVVAGDRGTATVLLEEDSPAKKAFFELADNVVKAVESCRDECFARSVSS